MITLLTMIKYYKQFGWHDKGIRAEIERVKLTGYSEVFDLSDGQIDRLRALRQSSIDSAFLVSGVSDL